MAEGCNANPSWQGDAENIDPTSGPGPQCLSFQTTPWAQPGIDPVASNFSDWCSNQIEFDGADPADVPGCVWAATVYAPAHPHGGSRLVNNEDQVESTGQAPGSPPAGHNAAWDAAYSYAFSVWNGQASALEASWGGSDPVQGWCNQIGASGAADQADAMAGCLAGVKAGGGS